MRTALIDGDVVAYRSAFIGMNEGMMEDEACDTAAWLTEEWTKSAQCQDSVMFLSPRSTFRHDLADTYKAHRKKRDKPAWLSEVRAFLAERFDSITQPNIEADDSLGIYQTARDDDSTVIVTVDKDLLQIPGRMYNPVKDTHHETTAEEGHHLFLTQWLTGDSVDGYPGLRGIGPKKAAALLAESEDPITDILALYEDKGVEWEECRTQAQFAMILTNERWDDDKQEPILWSPPQYAGDD